MSNDLAPLARELKLPVEQVANTVELLDSGNTIPFITRFRKDLTGGLNEKQILAIQSGHNKRKAIQERRTFILKSIESQGKLTDDLKTEIEKTDSLRRMEDLYLPFKTKKQSLAMTARQQGLQPLAEEVLEASSMVDLAARAPDFVRVDKGLSTVNDVIAGVGHILAEKFSENGELRAELRRVMWDTGKLASVEIPSKEEEESKQEAPKKETDAAKDSASNEAATVQASTANTETTTDASSEPQNKEAESAQQETPETSNAPAAESPEVATTSNLDQAVETKTPSADTTEENSPAPASEAPATKAEETPAKETDAPAEKTSTEQEPAADAAKAATTAPKPAKKKKKKPDSPFKDYFNFEQPIKQVLHHQALATNRGERAGALKIKVQCDSEKILEAAKAKLVPGEHPCKDFLSSCVEDSLNRLILPSLEREIRRELTETAENHAVEVFAKNLKSLLLQRPTAGKKILAIDPGYKSGCSIAILTSEGDLVESSKIFVVGNAQRKSESESRLVELIGKHSVEVIAIGNGTASRETELLVAGVLTEHCKDKNVSYTIINEAGTAAYSTSEIGREELPELSPNIRSAISIGRRLIDPLSELVKVSPANIGVGMYQHDVKAKHLSESLDAVVESCVNQVGVNANTASPSLLRYVSGLNQLTARRIYEYRQEHGPFGNREELKKVTGFGDATFTQAAGFLRIHDGEQPLDATSIHPESYELATKIVDQINAKTSELIYSRPAPPKPPAPVVREPDVAVETPTPEEAPVATEGTPVATPPETQTETSEPVQASPEAASPEAATPSEAVDKAESPATESTEVKTESTESSEATEQLVANAESAAEPTTETAQQEKPIAVETVQAPVVDEAKKQRRREIVDQLKQLDAAELAKKHSVGSYLVTDILRNLTRPRRDPRDGVNKPIFRKGLVKVEDLKPETQLEGQVVNVVDFGVFVDIGLGESCLVHVSQLSHGYIRNTHDVFNVGDIVRVWVTEFDSERRRLKLTAIRPGSSKPRRNFKKRQGGKPEARRDGKPAHARKSGANRSSSNRSGGRNRGKSDYKRTERPRRRTPKPAKPITQDMLEGKEPMRSFSDLLQFVEKKPDKKSDDSKDS